MAILIKCISCNLVWDKDTGTIREDVDYDQHISHGLCSKCLRERCLELFRSRQRKEGNFDCFGRSNGYCDQVNCKYRNVCLGISKLLEERGIYMNRCKFCGREYFDRSGDYCSLACEELAQKKILSICHVCGSVFSTSYLRRELRVCSQSCADQFFKQSIETGPVRLTFLCPLCYKEHEVSNPDLVFFDKEECYNDFINLYGKGTFLDLMTRFRKSFYSCERCSSILHLRVVRVKGELRILCPTCASFLRSDWNEEDTYVSTLDNYSLQTDPLFKMYPFDAGQDLRSLEDLTLRPKESYFFKTGISIEMPPDCVGLVKPRSGLAKKYSISVLGGVIDSNYRGEIQVGLINLGSKELEVHSGDRIAQILVMRINPKRSILVKKLSETDRCSKGFGHTGSE